MPPFRLNVYEFLIFFLVSIFYAYSASVGFNNCAFWPKHNQFRRNIQSWLAFGAPLLVFFAMALQKSAGKLSAL